MNGHEAEQALAALDRRGFLRLAGGLAALGLLPTGCGRTPAGPLAPVPGHVLRALSPRGYATFQVFAMTLGGPRVAAAIEARAIDPAAAADAWVARLPALAPALGQGLAVLEWGVWPLLPKWRTFTSLELAGRERVLEDLQRSPRAWKRDLYKGLKSLATPTVYAQPALRPAIGFPGPFDAAGIALAMSDLEEEEPPSPRPPRCARFAPASTSCRWASAPACACPCACTGARPW